VEGRRKKGKNGWDRKKRKAGKEKRGMKSGDRKRRKRKASYEEAKLSSYVLHDL